MRAESNFTSTTPSSVPRSFAFVARVRRPKHNPKQLFESNCAQMTNEAFARLLCVHCRHRRCGSATRRQILRGLGARTCFVCTLLTVCISTRDEGRSSILTNAAALFKRPRACSATRRVGTRNVPLRACHCALRDFLCLRKSQSLLMLRCTRCVRCRFLFGRSGDMARVRV